MDIANILKNGGIAVIPTDTIYGIVGSALNQKTVERIYLLRKRSPEKPFIILISSINDLEKFDVKLSDKQKKFLEKNWPNPLSVILGVTNKKLAYLHRGTKSLAFRMPKDEVLLKLLTQTGPLVAPSANFEGEKPAETITEAKKYFKDNVDLYSDGNHTLASVSTLIDLNSNGVFKIVREGQYKL